MLFRNSLHRDGRGTDCPATVPMKTVSKKHKFDDFAGQCGTVCPATVPTFYRKSLHRDSSPRLAFIILKGERGGAGRETAGGLSIVCQLVAQTGWTTDVTLVTKMLGSVILVFQNSCSNHRAERQNEHHGLTSKPSDGVGRFWCS